MGARSNVCGRRRSGGWSLKVEVGGWVGSEVLGRSFRVSERDILTLPNSSQ